MQPGCETRRRRGAEEALATDLDNLRAALDALATQDDQAPLHIELAGAVVWELVTPGGLRAEGQRRCRQALARIDDHTPPKLEPHLQRAWAWLVHRRGAEGDSAVGADRILSTRLLAKADGQ